MFTMQSTKRTSGDRGYQTSAIALDNKATTSPEQKDSARAYVSRFLDGEARADVLDALGLA